MAETTIWTFVGETASPDGNMSEAAAVLRGGGLVAFPTETVYGLGADARSGTAVAGIFAAKGRPSDNPLIVHIADREQLDGLVEACPPLAEKLMERFWPGPLTIVLPVRPGAVSDLVTAGLPTVGIRMPDHPLALALLRQSGCPVAAPSANRSGRPSPTCAEHVADDLAGSIAGIVDGGPTGLGLESTVVELEGSDTIRMLRPGGITRERLLEALPGVIVVGGEASSVEEREAPRSPGMKYAHYAPSGELTVVQGDPDRVIVFIREQARLARQRGSKTGVLAFRERVGCYEADLVLDCGSEASPDEAARKLYAALRRFDDRGIECIWAEACDERGIGAALMNRLTKAAGERLVQV